MAGFEKESRWCLDFTLPLSIPRQTMAASCMAPQKFKLWDTCHWWLPYWLVWESVCGTWRTPLFLQRDILVQSSVLYSITWPIAAAMSPSSSTCGHVLLWLSSFPSHVLAAYYSYFSLTCSTLAHCTATSNHQLISHVRGKTSALMCTWLLPHSCMHIRTTWWLKLMGHLYMVWLVVPSSEKAKSFHMGCTVLTLRIAELCHVLSSSTYLSSVFIMSPPVLRHIECLARS